MSHYAHRVPPRVKLVAAVIGINDDVRRRQRYPFPQREFSLDFSGYGVDSLGKKRTLSPSDVDPWAKAR